MILPSFLQAISKSSVSLKSTPLLIPSPPGSHRAHLVHATVTTRGAPACLRPHLPLPAAHTPHIRPGSTRRVLSCGSPGDSKPVGGCHVPLRPRPASLSAGPDAGVRTPGPQSSEQSPACISGIGTSLASVVTPRLSPAGGPGLGPQGWQPRV